MVDGERQSLGLKGEDGAENIISTSAVENERKHDDSMCGIHGYKTHRPIKN